MSTATPDRPDEAVDRMLAAVGKAIDDRRPMLGDWHRDAVDVLTEIEIAIARVQHPDDRRRLMFILGAFAGMWFDEDEKDAVWSGDSS